MALSALYYYIEIIHVCVISKSCKQFNKNFSSDKRQPYTPIMGRYKSLIISTCITMICTRIL